MYEIQEYRNEFHCEWDEVVLNSKNGNFLHLRNYMDYHAHRFHEQSVMLLQNGKSIAVFPCNRVDKAIFSHGGLTYAGLIFGRDLHAVDVLDIFRLLVKHYRDLGCSVLHYKAIPHIFHRYPAEEDLYALFRIGGRLVRRDLSSAIPLQNRIKLSDSRKSTIRKAEKSGLIFCENRDLQDFHWLLESVLAKFKRTPVHNLDELKMLQSSFPNQIRLFSAMGDGKLFAGALVYDFGHVVHTQYLASSEEGRKIGALDLVLFRLLDQVFKDRHFFSFGISTEEEGLVLNEGLTFQKEGFGARAVVQDFYEVDLK